VRGRAPARAILCACVGAREADGGRGAASGFGVSDGFCPQTSAPPGATAGAVLYAVDEGWMKLEGAHSVCLTEEGRRLIAKEAN
jgi:hypothetical protein